MAIKAGLVGLPNVGKSTLFNALTKSSVLAENYPFATIDPHIAITNVPDKRLEQLAGIFGSAKIIPATVQFVDIAGLVKGAAQGEGLGNQFLSNIMGVDLVLHVLRVFEDENITHVSNRVDPLDDFEVIMSELMLKDLESVEKREAKLELCFKQAPNKKTPTVQIRAWERERDYTQRIKAALERGDYQEVRSLVLAAERNDTQLIPLLSGKNFLIIANVSEDDFSSQQYKNNAAYQKLVERFGTNRVIPVSAKIEAELAQLPEQEAAEMMESLEINEKGLETIIEKTYQNLNLITFFTCGPKEAHAWSLRRDTNVRSAAGEIHSDLERGFICAEVYNCTDIFDAGTEQKLKETGKLRTEGKEYIVQDGDLLNIRFNV